MKALEFVNSVRQTSKRRRNKHFFAVAVNIEPHDTLQYVIHKLAVTNLHRLYIMETDIINEFPSLDKVHGVISLVDIIRLLF